MKRQRINQWSKNFSQSDVQLIQSALVFSGNKKRSNSNDQNQIAEILDHLNVDSETIVAAILLTSLELGVFDQSTMAEVYSASICDLAIQSQTLINLEQRWVDTLQGNLGESDSSSHHMMLLNMMKDIRVVFIILAYQVLRMHRLTQLTKPEQHRIAKETEQVFAPLANRLGIGQLKWELEDLAFRYLHPVEYKKIAKELEECRVDREQYMQSIVDELQTKLSDAGLAVEVQGRAKHIFSIWKKMQKKDLKFSDLYDVRAVRIMVEDLSSCYSALSVVHDLWQFIPSEYDDYVAAPKANNYQSLHTAVLGPEGKTVEIQIRTYEMHAYAELGVAAHWRYKEGGKRDKELEEQLESLRDALNQTEAIDVSLQKPSRIYVLSPKGHVVELPFNATPLDFAYHIHSEVGNRCRGAKVNGKMVPLTFSLLNGQTVEIITAKDAQPSRDWLAQHFGYLKSSRARSKVKSWFKREFREEHIHTGKTSITKQMGVLPSHSVLNSLSKTFNLHQVDDLYAAIGRGDLGVNQVLNSLKTPKDKEKEQQLLLKRHERSSNQLKSNLVVEGVDGLMTTLARCCKPFPEDPVVGFITKGRGVTIHREDCSNVAALRERNPQRFVDVIWGGKQTQSYEIDIEVIALDRTGLLRDVMAVLSKYSINVNAVNTFTDKSLQQARMRLTLNIGDPAQLASVLEKLIHLRGIFEARRIK
ncbi:MAG: bifunctional (p)ppGpp synthetase/guanosine-3',5'-bis(diphosphate) 3'-pyrophosphohydrolase [Gammaproteobacteria bacterium]|nr:bifunctional (p)ppGpp synthetase/guanosine-3',5'-bis(diphosphate) 3'-pyrophosphohydrolase [Gammaproteobacteria bacterium]